MSARPGASSSGTAPAPVAIIGGTGLAALDGLEITGTETVSTPWGEASTPVVTPIQRVLAIGPVPMMSAVADVTRPHGLNPEVQARLIEIYRSEPALIEICEQLTDLDEGFQEWRYRHMMMVQRTIGTKPGTGGSDGAAYLRSTLFRPAFPDLWAIRAQF